jgi:hypothetical protein
MLKGACPVAECMLNLEIQGGRFCGFVNYPEVTIAEVQKIQDPPTSRAVALLYIRSKCSNPGVIQNLS